MLQKARSGKKKSEIKPDLWNSAARRKRKAITRTFIAIRCYECTALVNQKLKIRDRGTRALL